MSYATWQALRKAKEGTEMRSRRRIGFGENESPESYDGRDRPRNNGNGGDMRMENRERMYGGDTSRMGTDWRDRPRDNDTEMRQPWPYPGQPVWPQGNSQGEKGRYRERPGRLGYRQKIDDEEEDDDEEDDKSRRRKSARVGGSLWMEPEGAAIEPLTKEQAHEWVDSMTAPDPNNKGNGGKIGWEEVKAMAAKHGITDEHKLIELYAVINAMKSDYAKVAQKYGVASPEYYYDLAKAFIDDSDAKLHKVARYYKYIAAR